MVFTQQQQLADHTSQFPEKTQRDARSGIHANVKTVNKDTPITAETHSIIKDRGCF